MIKISVIIPTYKPGDYIFQCLESLNEQTLEKTVFEVIIILNGCNQPWHNTLTTFFNTSLANLQINFIQTDLAGVSNARNIGIEHANGEYITFLDDDDYVSPKYLEAMLEQATPESIVLTDSRAFYDDSMVWIDNYLPHVAYQKCASRNDQNLLHVRAIFNGPCMKLIPGIFTQGEAFDTRLTNCEDGLFMFQISRHISKIAYAKPDAIYYRRYRLGSAVNTKKSLPFWIKTFIRIECAYIKSWLKHPFSYNFPFFISRVLASLKYLITNITA